MSKVFGGDEWKRVQEPKASTGVTSLRHFDRAERQRRVDDAYGKGRIDRYEWDRLTTLLSDVVKWKQWTDTEALP